MSRPTAPDPRPKGADPAEVAWRGIELCRQGEWKDGLYWLRLAAASAKERRSSLPALFYSFLGYGMAREGKKQEGLKLCRRAVELEFYQPDAYWCLARVSLLMGDKKAAAEAMEQGLALDHDHGELKVLRGELGKREEPVVKGLSRRHLLNRVLGGVRHGLRSKPKEPAEKPATAAKPSPAKPAGAKAGSRPAR